MERMTRCHRSVRNTARLAILIVVLMVVLSGLVAQAAEPDMTEVRRLAKQAVEVILEGAPIRSITDENYGSLIRQSNRPVVVMFYISQDRKSRNLATLIRYVAIDFDARIAFYAYKVGDRRAVPTELTVRLRETYSLDKVPGTFFYDNDTGRIELERENYQVPTMREYRTPGMRLWRLYYKAITKYIEESILD